MQAPPENNTLVSGRRLRISRAVWLVSAFVYSALFVLGAPNAFQRARVLAPATQVALAQLGISPDLPALYWLGVDTITFAAFAAVAFFIVWRRPNDWLVMLTSVMLLGTATLYTVPPAESGVPLPITALAFAFAEICQLSFLYLFPNGKFVPRWLWLFLLPLFLWRPTVWAFAYLPNFYATARTGDNFGTLRQDALDTGLIVLLFVIGIIAQIYRYRRVSTPIQRQQTKWLLFGMISAVLFAGSYVVLVNVLGLLEGGGTATILARMLGRTVRQLALFMLPLTLAFSILRYRLWEIDLLLRRTLVYAPLTGILAGLFAALIPLAQRVAVMFTGHESFVATLGATIIVVAAIEPLKQMIKRIVEQRFQNSSDPQRKLENFGERVQKRLSAVRAAQILRRFTDEAVTAFQADGGATFVAHGNELSRAYTRGNLASQIAIDVWAHGQRVGVIALGQRCDERPYSKRDRALLEKTAAIVGIAIEQDTGG